ncbi:MULTISPECIES: alpha/beta hydrolase fold domain-containing protein [Virgibacillus]|nr:MULTISPECIES: alpha/beta hydrolase fold domain-containing protein [Virgibacillus]MED3737052.1 alpha/beta hydrolase fold domain-containing protein [Virgibacillus pantothenticus]QTY16338.1 alpha/beta hydrolase fold domain-containing protein [Virgibacillus pantothenticus]SIS68752.1 Acetyl esterase/lipase [Virgibacillus pantothenticus]
MHLSNHSLMKSIETADTRMRVKLVPGKDESGYLDPKTLAELSMTEDRSSSETISEPTVEMMRAGIGWQNAKDITTHELVVEDKEFEGIPVRTYERKDVVNEVLPAIVFYHGGGFFGGSLDTVDLPCRRLADLAGIRVFSVEYGLAPEHPYPEAVINAHKMVVYIHHHHEELKVNVNHLNVMGDSAGGNLTYVVSLLDRLYGTNYIKNAVSVYPVVYQGKNEEQLKRFYDLSAIKVHEHEELVHQHIKGFMDFFYFIDRWYIQDADPESWMISPYNVEGDLLKNMPRTLYIAGEYDALRLQGDAFYEQAKKAGTDIYCLRYNGMIHSFMDKVGDYVQADDCLKESVQFILDS